MPDDAKPQPPIDLSLDFDTAAAKPAPPAAKPIDLDWFEPATPGPTPPAATPPVASLPEAAPVVESVVPVVQRAKRLPAASPVEVPVRRMQANLAPEFRKERPVKRHTVLASVVVLGLMLATAVAVLVLMYAIYAGFKAFTPRTGATTPVSGKR